MFLEHPEIREFDINPVILYEKGGCAVDARIYTDDEARPDPSSDVAGAALPDSLFTIQSVAVVGASQDPNKVGYAICRNLLTFPVPFTRSTRKARMILGRKTYPTLTAIPDKVDAGRDRHPGDRSSRRSWKRRGRRASRSSSSSPPVPGDGRSGQGPRGASRSPSPGDTASGSWARTASGSCSPLQGINTTFDPVSPKPGKIAFISQSGALITTIVDWSLPEEIGFSAVFSHRQPGGPHLRGLHRLCRRRSRTRKRSSSTSSRSANGKRFMERQPKVTPKKPVIAIKSGSSKIGQKAASSHTGSLAGSDDVYTAAFRQAGVIPRPVDPGSVPGRRTPRFRRVPERDPGRRDLKCRRVCGPLIGLCRAVRHRSGRILPGSDRRNSTRSSPQTGAGRTRSTWWGTPSADRFAKTFDVMIQHQDLWDIAFVIAVPSAISDPITGRKRDSSGSPSTPTR